MTNNLYQPSVKYSTKNGEINKIGGLNKTHKIIRTDKMLQDVENEFMKIAFKSNKAEAQRNERKAKRK